MKINVNSRFYKWEIIILLWIAYFLNQGDRQVFNTVLPHIQSFLGVSDGTMGLISTCFNLFFAMTVPFAGYFADRFSRSKIIIFSIALFSTATMFTGFANTVIMMILLRSVATGMGEAIFGPTYPAIIAEYHDSTTRARAMSIHQTAYYVGVIASGFLAGLIADKLGWQYSFIIFGAAGVLFTFVLVWRLKDKNPVTKETADKSAPKPSFFEAMAAIFKVPTAVCMIFGFTSLIFVLTGYLTWMPKYLMETFELSGASAGFNSMFWTYVAAFVGVLLAGTLSDKLAISKGNKYRMFLQAIGLVGGAVFLFFMGGDSSLVLMYSCFAGWGFFRAFFDANTYAVLYDVTPPRLHASCASVMGMTGFAVGALAPVILGALKQNMGSLSSTFPILAVVWVVCGVLMFAAANIFYKKDRERVRQEISE